MCPAFLSISKKKNVLGAKGFSLPLFSINFIAVRTS